MAPLPSSVYTSTEAAQKFASFAQKFASLIDEYGLNVPKQYGPFQISDSGLLPTNAMSSDFADEPNLAPTIVGQINRAAIAAQGWVYGVGGGAWQFSLHSGTSQSIFQKFLGPFKTSPSISRVNWGRMQVPALGVLIVEYTDNMRSVPVGVFFTPDPSSSPSKASRPYYVAAARVLTLPEVQMITTSSAVQSAASPVAKFDRY